MQLTAYQIANLINGVVEGDPHITVSRPSKIEEGGAGSITFLGNMKYEPYAYSTTASVLLVSKDFTPKQAISATLIRVDNVYAAINTLLNHFGGQQKASGIISEKADIASTAQIAEGVSIGSLAVVGAGSAIGAGAIIHPQVFIGEEVAIGEGTIIYPGARILDKCKIGPNCIIHSNVVIGGDGFGFTPQEDGTYKKVAHVGNVIIEADVEIGSNTTIDRGTMGSTFIRKGVKLDNLIQIGHNVDIGENTVIAAQTGIAGSTKIGRNCRIGGQVGFVGHVSIADGTQIQAQSGIAGPIKEPNTALFGSPAIPYKDYIRSYAIFRKLPELYKKIHWIDKQLNK